MAITIFTALYCTLNQDKIIRFGCGPVNDRSKLRLHSSLIEMLCLNRTVFTSKATVTHSCLWCMMCPFISLQASHVGYWCPRPVSCPLAGCVQDKMCWRTLYCLLCVSRHVSQPAALPRKSVWELINVGTRLRDDNYHPSYCMVLLPGTLVYFCSSTNGNLLSVAFLFSDHLKCHMLSHIFRSQSRWTIFVICNLAQKVAKNVLYLIHRYLCMKCVCELTFKPVVVFLLYRMLILQESCQPCAITVLWEMWILNEESIIRGYSLIS